MQQSTDDQSKPLAAVQSAESFRGFEQAFKGAQTQKQRDLDSGATERRHEQVEAMINTTISDSDWDDLIHKAQKAAQHGEKQYLLLRFPSDLCTDAARAINNPPNEAWPETLRGEAAAIYQRWNTTLRPHGFNLSAQVLDFPGGKPGDVGLFLVWGETF